MPEIINNLLLLDQAQVREVMTPRRVVMSSPEDIRIADFYATNQNLPFSRILLTEEDDKDAVTGYFLKDTLLESLLHDRGSDSLKSLKHEIITIPETFKLTELFDLFIEKREHIALVIDEFGSMAGIATMEDIIETLIGAEILDETDEDADMRERARQEWAQYSRDHGIISYDE